MRPGALRSRPGPWPLGLDAGPGPLGLDPDDPDAGSPPWSAGPDATPEPAPRPTPAPRCDANEFTCADHTCIPARWVCDGDRDCDGGEDERQSCPPGPPPGWCPDDEVACGDGECVPEGWTCDGDRDCATGADERNCQTCDSCIVAHCTPEHQQCQANPACVQLLRCRNACGQDQACRYQCDAYAGTGRGDLDAVFACARRRCDAPCGG
ncbi:MAG: LDL receptor domain-containing protein [bacterium]